MVVDDLGAEDDPLQVHYQNSLFKVADCEVGDFVGCIYDTKFLGRVIKKEPEKIQVWEPELELKPNLYSGTILWREKN